MYSAFMFCDISYLFSALDSAAYVLRSLWLFGALYDKVATVGR